MADWGCSKIHESGQMDMMLINGNGMSIGSSHREILDEVTRGTGFVMGEGISIYILRDSVTERFITLDRLAGSQAPVISERFRLADSETAINRFLEWMRPG
ncbi:MAG: hypothetical protein COV67_08370 [Nitrospinae bacterium CG11_big_fil_rev_8_21_14_0_20_56_8]|nr:MAG: hypothetical protein COV67_08370 [Nitrospinae bacterium CG11_big_fil_rev_8_21_14_0_20_56_8]